MAIGRGYLRRGDVHVGISSPYVSTGRCSLLDVDVYGHMNNAAFLTHFELARWEMSAASGMLRYAIRERAAFLIAAATLRFRREVRPFSSFEVHSSFAAADEGTAWLSQSMRARDGGRVLAQSLCRAVLTKGRERLSPRDVFAECGVSSSAVEVLMDPAAGRAARDALEQLESAMHEEVK